MEVERKMKYSGILNSSPGKMAEDLDYQEAISG